MNQPIARAIRLITAWLLIHAGGCAPKSYLPLPERIRPELVRPALPPPQGAGAYAVDAGGRPIRLLESGSTLHIGAQALPPRDALRAVWRNGEIRRASTLGEITLAPPLLCVIAGGVAGAFLAAMLVAARKKKEGSSDKLRTRLIGALRSWSIGVLIAVIAILIAEHITSELPIPIDVRDFYGGLIVGLFSIKLADVVAKQLGI